MANMTAAIANRGFYIPPHIVKKIDSSTTEIDEGFRTRKQTGIDAQHFDLVIDGMEDVVVKGTGRRAAVPGISICGKTGTAENPHGADHSLFVAFAPKDDPQIAIAVIVENAGFGSTWGAPIAGLMIEQYLKGEIAGDREWLVKSVLEFEREEE